MVEREIAAAGEGVVAGSWELGHVVEDVEHLVEVLVTNRALARASGNSSGLLVVVPLVALVGEASR